MNAQDKAIIKDYVADFKKLPALRKQEETAYLLERQAVEPSNEFLAAIIKALKIN